jgi:3-phenylpropionate/cinnamic acid dioxygenase small subunit
MNAVADDMNAALRAALDAGTDLLQREAMYLDLRRWDDWLALFHAECEYHVPMWRTADEIGEDPHSELSHLYYGNRKGLEDRIIRIRSGRSPASTPMPRTSHVVGGVVPLDPPEPDRLRLHSSWNCQVFFPRQLVQHAYFGYSEHLLERIDGRWRIRKKRVALLNDYIPSMLDVYCI